ncbi:MAG: hypothetical protein FJ044_05270 [Candidatus Cloacimonetes bacterium]|nr:hypothetical protein [Candidatus Cloacimonadota bacterium]
MNDTVIINDLEFKVWTGCGPGELGWGTGVWFSGQKIFAWDWPHAAAAIDGHKRIKDLLQNVAAALGPKRRLELLRSVVGGV